MAAPDDWLDLDGLTAYLQGKFTRRYVARELTKREDFPKPLALSIKTRFWNKHEVDQWFMKQRKASLSEV